MKVATTEVGGLAASLYESFLNRGRRVFTALIGPVRANQVVLEYTCVRAGGVISGVIFALLAAVAAIALVLFLKADPERPGGAVVGVFAGCMIGLTLASFIAAEVLIAYVKRLRHEAASALPKLDRNASSEERRRLVREHLAGLGYSSSEADREAWWLEHAYTSECFVATAVFEGRDVYEVRVLRDWRDKSLLNFAIGRAMVSIYDSLGPLAARFVMRHPSVRRHLFRILTDLAIHLRRLGYGG